MLALILASLALLYVANGFHINKFAVKKTLNLRMFDEQTVTYAGMALATIVPSIFFVKFVGESADNSRGNISDDAREKFKRKMMEQPNINLGAPTSEEDALKRQIAKAYMQDKDVDVAVLEEKLKKRAQWRKEMMAQAKIDSANMSNDDGW